MKEINVRIKEEKYKSVNLNIWENRYTEGEMWKLKQTNGKRTTH